MINIVKDVGGLIKMVTGMKSTKSCLCCRTVTVVMEWQQNNF